MTKIIISGICGKMGSRLLEMCFDDSDIEVIAGVGRQKGIIANIPVFDSFSDCDSDADVLVDFSNACLTYEIASFCERTNTALVLCTTGRDKQQDETIEALSKKVAVFKSANMSVGIALLNVLSCKAAEILGDSYDIEIVEKHHNQKVDAPSGTALLLANSINNACSNRYEYNYDRHRERRKRDKNEIGMHSIRGGTIVGEHEVIFAGSDEVITLTHSAGSKALFATGAVKAAKYIKRQKPGMYDMYAMLSELF